MRNDMWSDVFGHSNWTEVSIRSPFAIANYIHSKPACSAAGYHATLDTWKNDNSPAAIVTLDNGDIYLLTANGNSVTNPPLVSYKIAA